MVNALLFYAVIHGLECRSFENGAEDSMFERTIHLTSQC